MKSSIKFLLLLISIFATELVLAEITTAAERQKPSLLNNSYKVVIYKALVEQKAFHMGRTLANISHVCNLVIDGKKFPVIDADVIYSTGVNLRGADFMAILNDDLKILHQIPYAKEKPIFCYDNILFLNSPKFDFNIDGLMPLGNALLFSNMGKDIAVIRYAPEQYPKHIQFQ
ncbi:MAG: hypothetical protein D6B27_00390 [Gammaproteobacteria bacterium]|nr:MAG: hypothetical protein D6B27_00390 [Gammaproteobacteria bacterium]